MKTVHQRQAATAQSSVFARLALLGCLVATCQAADPVVSNISAVQRSGTQWVDISYDVTADTSTVSVTLAISSDGGTTFSVPATTVSGAVGPGVARGTGKVIAWNPWLNEPSCRFSFSYLGLPSRLTSTRGPGAS